jgi:hypothetical protein
MNTLKRCRDPLDLFGHPPAKRTHAHKDRIDKLEARVLKLEAMLFDLYRTRQDIPYIT